MLFRTRPNIPDLQLFLQMTKFSLEPILHQSQPANHQNPRIQIKRLPLCSSVANPATIQTKLQKTTLSSTFKITTDNCASSICSSCCRHSSDFKTISVRALIQRPQQNKGGKNYSCTYFPVRQPFRPVDNSGPKNSSTVSPALKTSLIQAYPLPSIP